MKIYLDLDQLYNQDVYKHKLAVILGRGKRRAKVLATFPTEQDFRRASMAEVAEVLGIKNKDAQVLEELRELDETYQRLTEPQFGDYLSNNPGAEVIMAVDTEYLWSSLDSIQYALYDGQDWRLGLIITNSDLGSGLSIEAGIDYLQELISHFEPDIFVGHDFKCDIRVLEEANGGELPALHNYDDTLKMVKKSNISNLIGGASLDKITENIFSSSTIGLFSAYQDLELFISYGLKDAIYPIYARQFFLSGKLPEVEEELEIDLLKPEELWSEIEFDAVEL